MKPQMALRGAFDAAKQDICVMLDAIRLTRHKLSHGSGERKW
jgi:hypothetical protein